ncbi:MAG: hypothetical protein H0V91_15985 [Flavisolibacter sp.]|nr:hypothetical protein [Flavisolibacter sp.]
MKIISIVIISSISIFSCNTPKNILDYNTISNRQFWSADWSTDNNYIAAGGVDSIVRIYQAKNLKLYKSFPVNSWIHVVKWHSDNKILSIATLDKYVQLLDIETGNIKKLDGQGGSRAISWNPSGDLLAGADLEGEINIWNKHGELIRVIPPKFSADIPGKAYLSIDWHPNKNVFIATNFQINLIDTLGNFLKEMPHQNKNALILCTKWHPSGKYFVIGDYGYNEEGKNVPSLLHFWSEDGKYIKSITGSKAEYRNLDWNKHGSLLATASDVLRVWNKEGILQYESPADSINNLWGISWSANGNNIVTASRFKTITLWDSTARLIKRLDIK